jgi:hypothetical protein
MSWAPPVPGVDIMARRSQGLLNVGTLSRGLLAVSGVICGSSAPLEAGENPPPLGGPGPVWVQLGPPLPPREGAVPGSPVQRFCGGTGHFKEREGHGGCIRAVTRRKSRVAGKRCRTCGQFPMHINVDKIHQQAVRYVLMIDV